MSTWYPQVYKCEKYIPPKVPTFLWIVNLAQLVRAPLCLEQDPRNQVQAPVVAKKAFFYCEISSTPYFIFGRIKVLLY
jgi:hypothetical protein